jgi:hypothetical protein
LGARGRIRRHAVDARRLRDGFPKTRTALWFWPQAMIWV